MFWNRLIRTIFRKRETDATNIDRLSIDGLLELNKRVCERIRMLSDKNTLKSLGQFNIGEQVKFECEKKTITGTVGKINRKTISVETPDGCWNIPPQYLKKT